MLEGIHEYDSLTRCDRSVINIPYTLRMTFMIYKTPPIRLGNHYSFLGKVGKVSTMESFENIYGLLMIAELYCIRSVIIVVGPDK